MREGENGNFETKHKHLPRTAHQRRKSGKFLQCDKKAFQNYN